MSARFVIIAAAVALCAGALLYSADYQSFVPSPPQAASMLDTK